MISIKNISLALFIVAASVDWVQGSYEQCKAEYGPPPPKPGVPAPVKPSYPGKPVKPRKPNDDLRSRNLAVDPRCKKYGYRRRTLEVSDTKSIAEKHAECLDVPYDMFLVIEGAHFAGLATPVSNYAFTDGMTYCPPFVVHSKSELNGPMEKLIVIASYSEIEQMDQDTKFHLGVRPLSSIMNAFDDASVGWKGTTKYNPVTNNCVSMLRNMADPLEISLDEKVVKFITNRLLQDSANHMFDIIEKSPTLKTLYNGSNRLLKAMSKEDILSRLINYYL